MLLKNFFFYIYFLAFNFSFYLFLILSTISFTLLFADLRKKFIMFILTILIYGVWGFMLDLDGIMLVFLTAEFTIFLLFLMSYLQLYSNYTFTSYKLNYVFLAIYLLFVLIGTNSFNTFYFFTSFYKSLSHIVSSDFYILYYFLFEKIPVLVVFLTIIISFFSLFFIVMYFSLKLVKLTNHKQTKNIYFLRKQILTKQTNFSSKVYTFQN